MTLSKPFDETQKPTHLLISLNKNPTHSKISSSKRDTQMRKESSTTAHLRLLHTCAHFRTKNRCGTLAKKKEKRKNARPIVCACTRSSSSSRLRDQTSRANPAPFMNCHPRRETRRAYFGERKCRSRVIGLSFCPAVRASFCFSVGF